MTAFLTNPWAWMVELVFDNVDPVIIAIRQNLLLVMPEWMILALFAFISMAIAYFSMKTYRAGWATFFMLTFLWFIMFKYLGLA